MQLKRFRVRNYRNVIDSDWINLRDVTAFVGQNEAGKSNLFEALYCINPFVVGATYSPDEDWPVDNWGDRAGANGKVVCEAEFALTPAEIEGLYETVIAGDRADSDQGERPLPVLAKTRPREIVLQAVRRYGEETEYSLQSYDKKSLAAEALPEWAKRHVPKFVYINDYEMSGAQIELNELKSRWDTAGANNRHSLSNEDQTILIILELAHIDLVDLIKKGETAAGRTIRSFDKRAASAYLTKQFEKLWSQKAVKFDIEIDGTTLNIFVEDKSVGMPVRLKRRSTGFRWYVSFAWKFTHASAGEYENCILLLEEPGIHLHYSGQKDLIDVFNRLSERNTILYTTHLASMVDLAYPERVRIIESKGNHLAVTEGVVSTQRAPMAVIETSLGLTPDLNGMLGNRQVLIVEGGTDALILNKLSGVLRTSGKPSLSDQIYLWPAQTASKTPMYAAFAIGQKWNAGVLLDSDKAGHDAKKKISNLCLSALAEDANSCFRVLMLADAAGIGKTDAGIEDLFPDDFYRNCVNEAYGLNIKPADLPTEGSDMIVARLESVLKARYGHEGLDKKRVLGVLLKRFDSWSTEEDLPGTTRVLANALFLRINCIFGDEPGSQHLTKLE